MTGSADAGAVTRLMAQAMEEELARQRGRPVRVIGIERMEARTGSSFRVEWLRVTVDGETPVTVFFKDLDPAHQAEEAKALRPVDLEPGFRELRMYRDVLSPERTGTLRLYGWRWEPEERRFWIFLEDGGQTLLRNTSNLERWVIGARWAGGFHARMRNAAGMDTTFLPCLDRAHFEGLAGQVADVIPELGRKDRVLVSAGLDHYVRLVDRLAALPTCVIHGQYFGQNILLRAVGGEMRAVPIDWETAAVGPGTLDLVSITSGKWTAEQRLEMQRAYQQAYEAVRPGELSWPDLREQVRMLAIYNALVWIAWWARVNRTRDYSRFIQELSAAVA